MFLYLTILILAMSVPLAFSFEKNLMLYKRWKFIMPAIFISMLLFGTWDIIFTHLGCWEFNSKYISGIYFIGLPIEEYLFFFAIPYACLFSFYAMKFHFPNYKLGIKTTQTLALVIILFSLTAVLTNLDRIYTVVDFTILALVVLLAYKFARELLQYFLPIFPLLLLPMLLINGILTGSGIDQAVFIYDLETYSGIHLLTMPIEDVLFAFSLLITVLGLTEFLEDRFKSASA